MCWISPLYISDKFPLYHWVSVILSVSRRWSSFAENSEQIHSGQSSVFVLYLMLVLGFCSWGKIHFRVYFYATAYRNEKHRSKFMSLFWAFFPQRNVIRVTIPVCMQKIKFFVNKLLLGQWVPNFISELSSNPQFTLPFLRITESLNKWLREKLSGSCSVFILLGVRTILFVKILTFYI